jgi:hypothetical protein
LCLGATVAEGAMRRSTAVSKQLVLSLFAVSILPTLVACHHAISPNDLPDASGPHCTAQPKQLVDLSNVVALDADVSGVTTPFITIDSTYLYYTLSITDLVKSTETSTLFRVPLGGGTIEKITEVTQIAGVFLTAKAAVLGSGAYMAPTEDIVSVPLDGGAPTTLVSAIGGIYGIDAQSIYYSDGAVRAIPVGGGSPRTITSIAAENLVSIGGQLYFSDASGNISVVPAAGGTPQVVATQQMSPLLVACGQDLCWMTTPPGVDGGSFAFERLAPGGTTTQLTTTSTLSEPHQLVSDGVDLYVAAGSGNGVVLRIPGSGGAPVTMVSTFSVGGVALDDACLYWSDGNGIYNVAKTITTAVNE